MKEFIPKDFETYNEKYGIRKTFEEIATHSVVVTECYADFYASADHLKEAAYVLYCIGVGCFSVGNLKLASTSYEKGIVLLKNNNIGCIHDLISIFNNTAAVYYKTGNFDKSIQYYNIAVESCKKVFGENHLAVATAYNNVALVYREQGDYVLAQKSFSAAMTIEEQYSDTERLSTATIYNNLATVLKEQGRFGESLKYFTQAKVIQEKILSAEHPTVALTYNNIAVVYQMQGDYEKAMDYLLKALAIQEKKLSIEHPNTSKTHNNLALVLKEKDK